MNHHFETSQRLQKFLIDIIKSALSSPMTNLVKINTNLDCNVPEKDIHKIAGPFIVIALIDNMFLDKYTQDKLDKLIATEEANHYTALISEDIINILSENEPLAKTNILFYLEKLYPNISSTQLNKSIKLLKDSNRIQTINRIDYIIVK